MEKKAPLKTSRWASRLYAEIDKLDYLPRRFAVDPFETSAAGCDVYRMVFEQTYLIFYTVDDDGRRVHIVSFRHGARSDFVEE